MSPHLNFKKKKKIHFLKKTKKFVFDMVYFLDETALHGFFFLPQQRIVVVYFTSIQINQRDETRLILLKKNKKTKQSVKQKEIMLCP